MYYENLLIGLLVFSGIIVGLTYFVADISSNYDKSYEDLTYLSKTNKIKESTDRLADALVNVQITGISFIDLPIAFFTGILGTFKLLFLDMSGVVLSLVTDVGKIIGLPAWFTGILSTILFLMLIFALIRLLLKTKV